jgi:nitrogenase-stabilizing/protective protein
MDDTLTLDEALADLSAAEDFLDYFGIPYDEQVVRVNRLHILQRYHDYLARLADLGGDDGARTAVYKQWLNQAYLDFVNSDSLTEKVFRVFQTQPLPEGGTSSFVPLDRIFQ